MSSQLNILTSAIPELPWLSVVHLSGEVDELNLPQMETAVNPLIQDINKKAFIFDLAGLKFLSSRVIGYFASTHTTLSRTQRRIVFINVSPTVNDIFLLVGLDQIIPCYANLQQAVNNLRDMTL